MTAWHASSGGSGPRPGYLRGSGQGHRRREQGPGAPRLELAHYVRAARHVVVSVRGRSERAERCPEGGGQAEAAGDDGGGPARDGQLAGGGPDSYNRGIAGHVARITRPIGVPGPLITLAATSMPITEIPGQGYGQREPDGRDQDRAEATGAADPPGQSAASAKVCADHVGGGRHPAAQ
jgi:hypothetical protein